MAAKQILKHDSTPWRILFVLTEILVLDKGCGIQFDEFQIDVFDKFGEI